MTSLIRHQKLAKNKVLELGKRNSGVGEGSVIGPSCFIACLADVLVAAFNVRDNLASRGIWREIF